MFFNTFLKNKKAIRPGKNEVTLIIKKNIIYSIKIYKNRERWETKAHWLFSDSYVQKFNSILFAFIVRFTLN